jgi:hypothetical protein
MWRKAWVEGNYIIVHCVPDELAKYHLSDLKQDVKSANTKFRDYLTELAQSEEQERARGQRETNQIHDLKQRLDFSD